MQSMVRFGFGQSGRSVWFHHNGGGSGGLPVWSRSLGGGDGLLIGLAVAGD
ncbi:unnamed protein product [Brassica napus]|uniref:(rape) hypothetical protein n=1 Tax=Brassica napus TaxID=3708 RepID=A0A817AI57_BRANA|nr:unnamed protein product [Brassica napus]